MAKKVLDASSNSLRDKKSKIQWRIQIVCAILLVAASLALSACSSAFWDEYNVNPAAGFSQ